MTCKRALVWSPTCSFGLLGLIDIIKLEMLLGVIIPSLKQSFEANHCQINFAYDEVGPLVKCTCILPGLIYWTRYCLGCGSQLLTLKKSFKTEQSRHNLHMTWGS